MPLKYSQKDQEWVPEPIITLSFRNFFKAFSTGLKLLKQQHCYIPSGERKTVRTNFPWKTSLISMAFISGSLSSHCSLMVPELSMKALSPTPVIWLVWTRSGLSCCAAAPATCFHCQHMTPAYVGAGGWEKGPSTNHSAVKDLG